MDVSVGSVHLTFPLNLRMGDMLALTEGDTLAQAGSLTLRVKVLPLLRGSVEVDELSLTEATINSRDLIAALRLQGHVGELRLDVHDYNLKTQAADINHLRLRNANLNIALADSVPEDTTESEPVLTTLTLDDIQTENVRLRLLLSPQADSIRVAALLGQASLHGKLDLVNGNYTFGNIALTHSEMRLDLGPGQAPAGSIDPTHLTLTNLTVAIPHFDYDGQASHLQAHIDSIVAREPSRPETLKLSARVEMDLNAFDLPTADHPDVVPGEFSVKGQMLVGWKKGLFLNLTAHGNLQQLFINRLTAYMPEALLLQAQSEMVNLTDTTGGMGINATFHANLTQANVLKELLPADVRQTFNIPPNTQLKGRLRMQSRQLGLNATLTSPHGSAVLDAGYGLNNESYRADGTVKDFHVNQFVALADAATFTGHVTAHGHGLDFFNKKTECQADIALTGGRYGTYDLSNAQASLRLADGILSGDIGCDNPQLQTQATLSGKMQQQALDAHLDLDLTHADLQSMGLYDDRLDVATHGSFDLLSDLSENFAVKADIDGIDIQMGSDSIHTEQFNLVAETRRDTTTATLATGDLNFSLHAPENFFTLLERAGRTADVAQKQWKQHALDVNTLKQYLPTAAMQISAGNGNPLASVLRLNGIRYATLQADIHTNPADGLLGFARATRLDVDSIRIDSVFFNMQQDSTRFVFRSGLLTPDQPKFAGFSAYLDGYASTTDGDVHLTYFNKQQEKGIDLGLHALVTDTALVGTFYPAEPVLGFQQFKLNTDNYLCLGKKNRIFADIRLQDTDSNSSIDVSAQPADSLMQDVRAVVKNLDVAQLLSVMPGMPDMTGKLNFDARYQQTTERFWVNGSSNIRDFAYEGTGIGNVGTVFDYEPAGTDTHKVHATLSHNGQDVAAVNGTYTATGDGFLEAGLQLDSIPMEMTAPFIPDQIVVLGGTMGGRLTAQGPVSRLDINGQLLPQDMTVKSDVYSLNLRMDNDTIDINDSRIAFDKFKVYGSGENPLTINGWVDFANTDAIETNLSLYGRNFKLIDAPRTSKSVVFGDMYGDFFARVNGTTDDLRMRGLVKVLSTTNMTYVLEDTPLSVDDRLSDIVTFVDFTAPPNPDIANEKRSFNGIDMQLTLIVEEGSTLRAEFSADKQSYVNVQGSGNIVMNATPEGVFTLMGRYTVSEGQMKYTLPVIPLKTFTITPGSYVEFTGEPMNPTLSFAATEQTHATVSSGGNSRSVLFNAGLQVSGTLENMELLFTIEAPEDISVQNELAALPKEDKNKLAVGLLCTGLYMSSTNSSGISANNALNNFLQSEINNIAGQALATTVDVNVGMEQSTRDDGTTRTDYSFKFSKRFFSNRLNVVIGGKVNADGNSQENESGAYIDDVSLEWRLDKGGSKYVRLYHEKNYDNLIEGELIENGASVVIRKKYDKLSELLIWREKDKDEDRN